MYGLSANPAMFNMIKNTPKTLLGSMVFGGLSVNQALTLEFIEDNLDKQWHFGACGISNNPKVTPEFVMKYADKDWVFHEQYGLTFEDPRPPKEESKQV